jgi:hypothetical protein
MLGALGGIGAEYLITPHWTTKLEAEILVTPSVGINSGLGNIFLFGTPPVPTSAKVTAITVKIGSNYKF